ncbi:MAG: 50S ribosomal protein L1, partial [Methanomicrobia archaeon]|nr:50S ribosomal protein L1 [Methanomicrobia archaeon]
LMPNPKTGTVAVDIAKAIQEIKAGKVEYRVDKEANMHVCVARCSFDGVKVIENITTLVDQLIKVRPSSVKGIFFKNAVIHTTMGPAIHFTFNGRN